MITVLFHMSVKPDRDSEWRELVSQLTRSTRNEDAGCLNYTFHRQVDSPYDYVLYEQWTDQDALSAHLARLIRELGPPPPGGRLPAAFVDYFDRTQVLRYEALD